jgi:hypothetical protein
MRAHARAMIVILAVAVVARAGRARAAEAAAPDDDERYALRAEVGAEYDSNPHRTEILAGAPVEPPIVGSPLARLVLSGTLFDTIAPGQSVSLAATAAAKKFATEDASQEDVVIAQSSGAWRLALDDRTRLVVSGAYYEAFQRRSSDPVRDAERRDFRSLLPLVQLGWLPSRALDLTVGAGWRFLVYKPDRDFDFDGPTASVDLRWVGQQDSGPDWEVAGGAALEHRDFGGPALSLEGACNPPGLPCPSRTPRADDFLTSHVEATRTARVLLGAGYAFHYNRSNSYGETVMRHFATARFAAPLPFDVTFAARAELLFAFYRDQIPVSGIVGNQFVGVDYESRSSVGGDLSGPIGDHLRLYARYTYYFNELGSNLATYNRQTFLLSLSYTYEK